MYAIIETGGKQYRVEKGDIIDVELIEPSANGTIEFKHVLFLNNAGKMKIGAPHLTKCAVHAQLVQEIRGPKVIAFKYKERKTIRRKVGHRQRYSRVKITDIVAA
jgi:large subunit ribosomal protein L21